MTSEDNIIKSVSDTIASSVISCLRRNPGIVICPSAGTAAVYRETVMARWSTASAISDGLKMNIRSVYRYLKKLEEMGLVAHERLQGGNNQKKVWIARKPELGQVLGGT